MVVILLCAFAVSGILIFHAGWEDVSCDGKVTREHPDEPMALLHFGPRKTASSSIQRALALASEQLAEDGFVFSGHLDGSYSTTADGFLHFCYLNKSIIHKKKNCEELAGPWETFSQDIAEHHKNGRSFVYSDEGIYHLAKEDPRDSILEGLERLTAPYRGNRYVTVNYRDYPDWILSDFQFRNGGNNDKPRSTRKVNGFVDWYRDTKRWRPFLLQPMDEEQLTLYEEMLGPVYIFNMHHLDDPEDDLIVAWFCQALPWATSTCQKYREDQATANKEGKSSIHLNSSKHHLPAIRLAQFHLHLRGRHKKKNQEDPEQQKKEKADLKSMRQEGEIIEAWLHNMTVLEEDIPLECLSEAEAEEIWETSIKMRESMVPDFDVNNVGLRDKFETKIKSDFCQIDYDRLAEMPAWKDLWADIYG